MNLEKCFNNDKNRLLFIFLLALSVRLLYTLSYDGPVIIWAEEDEQNYIGFAKAFEDQGFLIKDYTKRYYFENKLMDQPWDLIPPGYPAVIFIFLKIFGERFIYLFLFQSILSAFIPVVFYLLLKSLMTRKYSFFFSLWAVFYYPYIRYGPTVLKEVYLFLFFLLIIYIMTQRIQKAISFAFFLYIFLFVILLHFDERFLPYLFIFPLIQIFILKTKFKLIVLSFSIILFCLVPWNIVVYRIDGKFKYMCNRIAYFKMDEVNQQRAISSESYIKFKVSKAVISFKRYFSIYRSSWPLQKNIVILLQFGVLIPLFFLGIYYLFRLKNNRILIFLIILLIHLGIHLALWGQHRYRYPVDALFAIISFWGTYIFIFQKRGLTKYNRKVLPVIIPETRSEPE